MNVEWQLCCILLRKYYKSLHRISREIGSDGRHLNRLAAGNIQQPKFDTGMKLLELAFKVLPQAEFQRICNNHARLNISNNLTSGRVATLVTRN